MYDAKLRFKRGTFKYLILEVLKAEPLHGYEIIQRIGEMFDGIYEPSPGVVYPTLQWLEDMDYVISERIGRKNVYHITEKGLEALRSHEAELEEMLQNMISFREFFKDVGYELFPLIKRLVFSYSSLSQEDRKRIRKSLDELVKELRDFLGD